MKSEKVIAVQSLCKTFHDPVNIDVLKNISFSINRGEFVSVIGKSGCGKSTLLYILSTMDTDYTGDLYIDNEPMQGKTERELALVRNEKIGFVFQFHYLLNELTVLKNVMLPGFKAGKMNDEDLGNKALALLKNLGIQHLAHRMAYQLSGGEKQRIAIARALINDPLVLMCDEPTGNLDNKNTDMVFDIFKELTSRFNTTLLVVTHDMAFAEKTNRTIKMDDGKLVE